MRQGTRTVKQIKRTLLWLLGVSAPQSTSLYIDRLEQYELDAVILLTALKAKGNCRA